MDSDSQSGVPRVTSPSPIGGVFDELSKTLASARETLSGFLDLVSLEGRRAGVALVRMLVGGLLAAIFFVAAWTGAMAALALFAMSFGMPPIGTVIVLAGVNLLAGAGMLYVCAALSRPLLFAATRRQFAGVSTAGSQAP